MIFFYLQINFGVILNPPEEEMVADLVNSA